MLTRFIFIIIACSTCLIAMTSPLFGQTQTAREDSGYRGPIAAVTIRSVKYSRADGKVTKSKKLLRSTERFDRHGNLLRRVEYEDDGIFNWDERSIFRRGKVVGWTVSSGPKDDFSSFFYRFDRAGNIIEENSYDEAGKLSNQTTYKYDRKNHEIERVSGTRPWEEYKVTISRYDAKGRQIEVSTFLKTSKSIAPLNDMGYYRRVLHYGNEKRWNSAESFSADGKLVSVTKLKRDRYGNETEYVVYNGSGDVKSKGRYKYDYDRHGNLIVEKSYRLKAGEATEIYELEEVTYRKYEYFK